MNTSGLSELSPQELALVLAVEYVSKSDYLPRNVQTVMTTARQFNDFLEDE